MALTQKFVDRDASEMVINQLADRAGIGRETTSSSVGLASTAAIFISVAPFVSRRWRRFGIAYTVAVALVSIVVSIRLPADAFVALPLGAVCGTLVLLGVRTPGSAPHAGGHRLRAGRRRAADLRGPPGQGRRSRLHPVLRHPRRWHRPVRQSARPTGAGSRPDVPRLPVPPVEERRRRPTVLVASAHDRARGADCAPRPRCRGATPRACAAWSTWAPTRCCWPTT